jgi:hypothetical protein
MSLFFLFLFLRLSTLAFESCSSSSAMESSATTRSRVLLEAVFHGGRRDEVQRHEHLWLRRFRGSSAWLSLRGFHGVRRHLNPWRASERGSGQVRRRRALRPRACTMGERALQASAVASVHAITAGEESRRRD